mmetsp:Transcript_15679/g.36772  ORF Transcript_15679/g.36772 Transcript_15679/m.36772 type:complete len:464 (-) Transcript_15679:67-1458(-)|eukprot:CAMPEP_0178423474 /NCGR_PEP_ID=MMETSP0689_2-20121128/27707_1 /TAXON_ID=160604 /ORGANISM="Amphidinium massartii, Strain CS-259" /LENGTH=463 /DNA_ID=CAMNT_0020045069 /DNA_START=24 /DNA_END=1415 /DNA_ORIENTATION=-
MAAMSRMTEQRSCSSRQLAQLAAAAAGLCGVMHSAFGSAFTASASAGGEGRLQQQSLRGGKAAAPLEALPASSVSTGSSVARSLAPMAGAAMLAMGRGRQSSTVPRKGGAGAGGDIEDIVQIRGFPLPPIFTAIGLLLLAFSGYDYFSGAGGSFGGLGSFVVIYAVPCLLIGISLFYAELQPVPVETVPGAEGLFDEKATATLQKVKTDVTRHRYGDDAHLDSSLRVLGLAPVGGGKWPKLILLKEDKTADGELEFTLYFESKDVPYTRWSDPNKIKSFDRYFGPGVYAQVYKEDGDKRIAALKLTTGTRPEGSDAAAPVEAAATAAAAFGSNVVRQSGSSLSSCFAGASLEKSSGRVVRMSRAAAPEEVDRLVGDNSIIVFSKSWCPFCRKAKKALEKAGAEFTVVELDERDDGEDVQAALLDKTGVKTVPQVFLGGRFIGGGTDTVQLQKSGELAEMIAEL